MPDTGWIKSSRNTSGSDNCVEVRITGDATGLRDSKNPAGEHLTLTPVAFATLLSRVRAG